MSSVDSINSENTQGKVYGTYLQNTYRIYKAYPYIYIIYIYIYIYDIKNNIKHIIQINNIITIL